MPTIPKEEILRRLENIPDFKEYSVDEDTLKGTSKKARFTHIPCSHSFDMVVKDFLKSQRCPKCAALKRIISNTKNTNLDKKTKKPVANGQRLKPVQYYIDKINSIEGYTFQSIDGEYCGNKSKALIKHEKCGNIFSKTIIDFTSNKQYCPLCIKTGKRNNFKDVITAFDNHGFELLETEGSYNGTHRFK